MPKIINSIEPCDRLDSFEPFTNPVRLEKLGSFQITSIYIYITNNGCRLYPIGISIIAI